MLIHVFWFGMLLKDRNIPADTVSSFLATLMSTNKTVNPLLNTTVQNPEHDVKNFTQGSTAGTYKILLWILHLIMVTVVFMKPIFSDKAKTYSSILHDWNQHTEKLEL